MPLNVVPPRPGSDAHANSQWQARVYEKLQNRIHRELTLAGATGAGGVVALPATTVPREGLYAVDVRVELSGTVIATSLVVTVTANGVSRTFNAAGGWAAGTTVSVSGRFQGTILAGGSIVVTAAASGEATDVAAVTGTVDILEL